MGRAVVTDCLPWLGLLAGSLICAWFLLRLSGSRLELQRLWQLHRDQHGSVQSLSFVLTLPFFVMIILFIVQVSQLMIGTIVVHYAAFATARSAVVWIPADIGSAEGRNCISFYYPDPDARDQTIPIFNPDDPNYGPTGGGMTYVIEPGSPKYDKISSAAVMACMSVCPSRDLGLELTDWGGMGAEIIKRAYAAMVPKSQLNTRIPTRLENKLAYALRATRVEMRFYHKNSEPPLTTYWIPYDENQFRFNELGWQDQITVTVKHDLALLPGPGRFLARRVRNPDGSPDRVSEGIQRVEGVYVYQLKASATMCNEGEKSVIPYLYQTY